MYPRFGHLAIPFLLSRAATMTEAFRHDVALLQARSSEFYTASLTTIDIGVTTP